MSILSPLRRGLAHGARDLWRNGWLASVAFSTLLIAFFALHLTFILSGASNAAISVLQNRVDLSLTFSSRTSAGFVDEAISRIREIRHVVEVSRTDRQERLENLKKRTRDTRGLDTALTMLGENPLGDLVTVRVDDFSSYPQVSEAIEAIPGLSDQAQIHRRSTEAVLERLTRLVQALQRGVQIIVLIFGLIALLVVVNMIRMMFYTHRDEISIMRLVGASDGMIRAPFFFAISIITILAFIGSIILVIIAWQAAGHHLLRLLGPDIEAALGGLMKKIPRTLALEFISSLILVLFVSAITMRRYLKV